jgi:hypothetical protein
MLNHTPAGERGEGSTYQMLIPRPLTNPLTDGGETMPGLPTDDVAVFVAGSDDDIDGRAVVQQYDVAGRTFTDVSPCATDHGVVWPLIDFPAVKALAEQVERLRAIEKASRDYVEAQQTLRRDRTSIDGKRRVQLAFVDLRRSLDALGDPQHADSAPADETAADLP